MVLKESALDNNLRVMAAYARARGFDLAPHGKTTMAPELFRRQLEAGAWAITVANVAQANVAFGAGAARVLVANEIVGTADAAWAVGAVRGGDHELLCLVDSVYGVGLLDNNLGRAGMSGRLGVLVEVGFRGGRSGVRSEHDVFEVAAALSASAHLRLVGVEGYEGGIATDRSPESLAAVDSYLDGVRRTVVALAERGAFPTEGAALVSAGGSKYFDRVADILGAAADYGEHPVRLIARSGCYVTHDHGLYEAVSPLASSAGTDHLVPALELWAEVLSVPEEGLAIVGLGKRDTSFDLGLPVPLHVTRSPRPKVEAFTDGALVGLDDQHGYFRLGQGASQGSLLPGDRIGFGLSHPCTAFDKWRTVLLVDDAYTVRERIRTCFH
jgi:D-serine deaminase-like pyridoxal phosphate-dependent protein